MPNAISFYLSFIRASFAAEFVSFSTGSLAGQGGKAPMSMEQMWFFEFKEATLFMHIPSL
eukprot:scaffold37455_cov333-Skeletonema_dohrnii-CCMP3373.AAC.2